MNKKDVTIKTYNDSANTFIQLFEKSGARIKDIEKIFSYLGHVKNQGY